MDDLTFAPPFARGFSLPLSGPGLGRPGRSLTRCFRRLPGEAQGPQPLGLLSNSATLSFVEFHRLVPCLLTLLRRLEAGLRLGNLRSI
jgi:hypothetical protein